MNIREIAAIMADAKGIHFVGIGGISMSSLSAITKTKGYTVTGSDRTKSAMTERLEKLGITVHYSHSEDNVLISDVIVYTAAVHPDNPELKKGRERGIPLITRGASSVFSAKAGAFSDSAVSTTSNSASFAQTFMDFVPPTLVSPSAV